MNTIIRLYAAVFMLLTLVVSPIATIAQEDIPADTLAVVENSIPDISAAVDSITSTYDSEWKNLSMQGKLSFDGLPLRPNVKVFMSRGESIIMSARASIFGEVARVEVSPDSITCINKHSRTYCSYPLDSIAPGLIADMQDILLGQVALPGVGRFTDEMAVGCEWIDIPDQGVMLYPGPDLQMKGMECAYIMEPEHWQLLSFALLLTRVSMLLETTYLYGEDGWTLGMRFTIGDKPPIAGELELSYPDYEPVPMTFTDAGAKYRKTDFKGLMRF